MSYWNSFPIVRYGIFLILGILLSEHLNLGSLNGYAIVSVLSILYASIFVLRKRFRRTYYSLLQGVTGLLIMVCIGVVLPTLTDQSNHSSHYTNHQDIKRFSGTIVGDRSEHEKYDRFLVKMRSGFVGDSLRTLTGMVMMYVRKDSIEDELGHGDQVFVQGHVNRIPGPKNPKVFDYALFMSRKQIWGQVFVDAEDIQAGWSNKNDGIASYIITMRKRAKQVLNDYISGHREAAIAQALLIGEKEYLDPEIKRAYATAGAMHVLAVSGLHVGIVYLLVLQLFGRIKHITHGRWYFLVIALFSIWFYALITGLSASVQRASVMFSILIISEAGNKTGNVYNSLGIAALILLVFDPFLVYTISFQLSFLAVLGIVYLYPRLYRYYQPKWILIDKIWSITCISLAAQLATFPLSFYYFNQFPTYFLLSNLLVIPGAFLVVLVGIPLLLIWSIWAPMSNFLGDVLHWILYLMNEGVLFIDSIPGNQIKGFIDSLDVGLVYLILFVFLVGYRKRAFNYFLIGGILICVINMKYTMRRMGELDQTKLVVYAIRSGIALDMIEGRNLTSLFVGSSMDLNELNYQVDPNRRWNHLPPVKATIEMEPSGFKRIGPLWAGKWKDVNILILNESMESYDVNNLACDILILSNNAVRHIEQIEEIKFNKLLLGADNNFYTNKKLTDQAIEKKLDVHSLPADGYWMLDLNKQN